MSIPEEVTNSVVTAYYPRTLAAPDAARTRAQAAYGIASAIAATLVAAGVFGGLASKPIEVRLLGLGALLAWLVVAGLFTVAVSKPFEETHPSQPSAEAFVHAALAAATKERRSIEQWQTRAWLGAAGAASVTLLALVFGVFDKTTTSSSYDISLSASGAQLVAANCGKPLKKIVGSLDPADLEKNFVRLDAVNCNGRSVSLLLPRSAVDLVSSGP